MDYVELTNVIAQKATSSPTPYLILPVDESVLTNQEGLVNIICDKFTYNDIWTEEGRGNICVESMEANYGSYTRNPGGTATIKFIGKKFHILAFKQENSDNAEIRFDNQLIATINLNSNNGTRFPAIAFTSHEFEYCGHTLEIKNAGIAFGNSTVFASIYVDPLPSIRGFKLSYEDFEEKVGEWIESTSTSPPTFMVLKF